MADNAEAEGRKKNRRVEIVIVPKQLTQREREIIRQGEASGDPDLMNKARSLEQYK